MHSLVVMHKPCGQFTCFQISLQDPEFSPGLFFKKLPEAEKAWD